MMASPPGPNDVSSPVVLSSLRRFLRGIRSLILDKPDVLRAYADLLRSVLSWPVAALVLGLVFLSLFKSEFKVLVTHIGTVTVGSVTLTTQEQALDEKVLIIQRGLVGENVFVPIQGTPASAAQAKAHLRNAQSISKIYGDPGQDPRKVLVTAGIEFDNAVVEFLAESGYAKDIVPDDTAANLKRLAEIGYIQSDLRDAGILFVSLRRKLLAKKDAAPSELLSMAQSGAIVLQALNSLPRDHKTVSLADVPIFGDANGQQRLPGVGVVLETTRIDTPRKSYQLFPTTRVGYYHPGMHVSWEWNFDQKWGEAWYRDPSTKQMTRGFLGSGNFVGRDLKELTR